MRSKKSARKARQKRDRNRRLATRRVAGQRSLRCEPLESRVLLDAGGLFPGDGLPLPFPDPIDLIPPLQPGFVSGRVWEDVDGNRGQNGAEPGMGGVTVYSDINFNSVPDAGEPRTVTTFDDPDTDFDEGGFYTLENLQPGFHNLRQLTPSRFEQTYPSLPEGYLPPPWGDPSVHVTFVEQGQTVDDINFGNRQIEPGSVSGVKWEDRNGDGARGADEPGLAGVTIYADLNFNAEFDADEPHAVTTADIPATDFDEGGRYTLNGLAAGEYVIREVVPDGFRQTFPLTDLPRPLPTGADSGGVVDEFATVEPRRLDFHLVAGEVLLADVAITVHASIFVPIDIDISASPLDPTGIIGANVLNLSGPQTNGGSGDTSHFQMLVISDGADFAGELQFVDLAGGNIITSIPLTMHSETRHDGAHHVRLGPGEAIAGIDFGNQPIEQPPHGSVSGRKWADLNGNGERDATEPGLAGVTIYSDLNFDGRFDPDEPHAVTTFDLPDTAFDEGGLYSIGDLTPGVHVIREVLPAGYVQIFPSPLLAIPNSDAHTVFLAPGDAVDGLDFGNLLTDDPGPGPGDLNGDGVVDGADLGTWEAGYGANGSPAGGDAASNSDALGGAGFLQWQRNYGRVTALPPVASGAGEGSAADAEIGQAAITPVGTRLAPVDLAGRTLRGQGRKFARLSRARFDVLAAAFAESAPSSSQAPARSLSSAEQAEASTPAHAAHAAVARRADHRGFSTAIDAALESEFGG